MTSVPAPSLTESSSLEPEPYSMLEWATVERTRLADGTEFVLGRHGEGWVIRVGARILMSNRMHGSEEALASLALARVEAPRVVLVGGLGLGYTARAVLDAVGPETRVVVHELVPELVDWNRRYLGHLAGHPLGDPRCVVVVGDVFDTLRKSPSAFDVVILDVDNGPQGLTQPRNQRLYGEGGVRTCLASLRPNGALAVWSQGPNAAYRRKLERHATNVEMRTVAARQGSSWTHVIFLATHSPTTTPRARSTPGRLTGA